MAKTNIYIDGAQAGMTLKALKQQYNAISKEIQGLTRDSKEYKDATKRLGETGAALNKHKADVRAISDSYAPAKSNLKGLMGQMLPFAGVAGLIAVGVQGVTAAIKSWYNNNKEMEKSLSSLKSITGASTADIEFYKETAKEMGRTTTLSAIQAVEAFKLIGSARPDLLKDREALAAVTHEAVILSEAAGMELAPAAQALASTMNQFNLGASDSKRIINALAAGSVAGAAEIEDLTATIDKAGTVMNSYNVSVEEGVALTELLSEKNLKGAEAGTQLRNVLLNMSTAKALDDKALADMERLGVNLDIVTNKAVPFNDRLKEMSKISQDQTALLHVFGKENIVVGQTILQNVDHFMKLKEQVTGTNTAYVQARINNDNLDGDLKKLSSAWEGLTLSTSAAQSPMRGIVQIGTETLNWITDVIGLLTEWDDLKFEEVLLDFAKYLTYINPLMFVFGDSLREAIDEQARMNRLTQEVVDGMKSQADEASTLIQALELNNKALKDKNLTEIEASNIAEENAGIIEELNSKYPKLTKNYDLQSASSKELSKLQKEITNNLLDQSIAAVQASEAERILAEMVQQSMQIASARADEQNRWAVTNFALDIFTDDAADLEEQLKKSQGQLEQLPETMKKIGKRVKGLNINFGEMFETQTKLIEESVSKINNLKLNKNLFAGTPFEKMFESQIKSEQQILDVIKEQRKAEKEKYATKLKDIDLTKKTEKELEAYQTKYAKSTDAVSQAFVKRIKEELSAREKGEKTQQIIADKSKAKADAAAKKWADLKKTLDDIISASSKFQTDFDYEKKLAGFKDEIDKEIFITENAVAQKYAKDIASATKLAQEKGKIGEDARQELSNLEKLKKEETQFELNKIIGKYRKEGDAAFKESKEKQLTLTASYEQAMMDIKVARAYVAAQSVKKGDIKAQKEANEELNAVLIEQLEFEAKKQQEALDKQLKSKEISEEEYNARKTENETLLAEKIKAIHVSTQEDMMKMFQERFQQIIDSIGKVVDSASKITDAYFNVQKNNIDKDRNYAIASEQEKLDKGIISREEFELKKQAIQAESDKKAHALEVERAKAAKAFSLFQIALSTAEAVAKAVASSPLTFGLPFSAFALVTGAAQAAVVLSEPLPQFVDGGFRNIIGANDGKTYNAQKVSPLKGGMTPNQPSYALFSEQGPEYFVPNNLLRDTRVANMVNAIEAIRTNQNAGASVGIAPGTMSDPQLVALLNANLQMMTALNAKIPNMGVKIGDKQIDDISIRTNELNSFKA